MSQRKHGGTRWLWIALVLVVVVGYGIWACLRPLGLIQPQLNAPPNKTTASKLVWPPGGQAAVGVLGTSILQTNNPQTPVPTASTAKIITALTVLQEKPLKLGEQGPLITLSAADVALYNQYVAEQGSVVQVTAGEQISEYQMLETLLLPSANNMADSLAIWAFGSLSTYNTAATAFLTQHGLTNTHIGSDASGFEPSTTSTAHDLVLAGELAMQNPVLAQIVAQPTASGIPVVNTIKNVNFLLDTHNIIGLKTGNTDQAGGVFVSASTTTVSGQPMTIITAYMDAPDLYDSLSGSLPLITSAQQNFQTVHLVASNEAVGSYHLPWGPTIQAVATQNLNATAWNGTKLTASVKLASINPKHPPDTVGTITSQLDKTSTSVKLQTPLQQPTIWWRLLHPLQ